MSLLALLRLSAQLKDLILQVKTKLASFDALYDYSDGADALISSACRPELNSVFNKFMTVR